MKTVEVNLGMIGDRKILFAAEEIKAAGNTKAHQIAYAIMRLYVKKRKDRRDNARFCEMMDGEQ